MSADDDIRNIERKMLWLLAQEIRRQKGIVVITKHAWALVPEDPSVSLFLDARTGNYIAEPEGDCPFPNSAPVIDWQNTVPTAVFDD